MASELMPDPIPDTRATVELLTELESIYERAKGKTYSLPLQVTDEVRVFFKLDDIIRDLRRLVEVEAAAQAVCDPEVKRWSGVYSGEPWYSVPGELLTALANALAHREGQ